MLQKLLSRSTVARVLVVTLVSWNLLTPLGVAQATYVPDRITMNQMCIDMGGTLDDNFNCADPYGQICAMDASIPMCDPVLIMWWYGTLTMLHPDDWYDILANDTEDNRSATVQYQAPLDVPIFYNLIFEHDGNYSTFVNTLSVDAISHTVVNMSLAQLQQLISEIFPTTNVCATFYSFIAELSKEARSRIISVLTDAQLSALIDCMTSDEIKDFLIGTSTAEALPCDTQLKVINAMSQERLDQFLTDIAAEGTAEADRLFTKVCTAAAEAMITNSSDEGSNAIMLVLSAVVIGALLYAFSSGAQAVLTSKLASAGVSAGGGVLRPHGGRAIMTIPCTCMSGSYLIIIGALTNPLIIGPRMWVAGITQQFAVGNIFPSAWQLGLGTGTLQCYIYAGYTCVPIGGGPIMLKNGTSAY